MNFRTNARTTTALLTVALTGLAPIAAQADTTSDQLQYEATIYGWFPAIGGSTAFPDISSGSSVDVTADQVIDALKMAFMGTFGVKKGQWGAWTDVVYADLGGSKSGKFGYTNASLDMKSWLWTVAGTYELAKTPENTTDLVFGARLLDIQQTLGLSLLGVGKSIEVTENFWDAIIGVKGAVYLGAEKKWFVPYYADIGTGQSDLTWQVNAGIGYRYNWGAVVASWRYLDYEFSDSPIQSLNFNGPLIGATFVW